MRCNPSFSIRRIAPSPESIGIGKVRLENAPQHLASALVHFRHARMIIDILIQKFPERAVRFGQFIAVTNQRRGLPAHVVCALHAGFGNRFRAGRNQVVHFAINDVANNQLVQLRFARVPVTREHCAMTVAPDLVLFQSRRGQNFKIKRVIEVVTVIRDLIRQVGNLRLQRWTIVFFP